jgi:hypothetical protein
MIDPITAAKLWLLVKPVKRIKEARQRRREKRMAESSTVTLASGETLTRTEPTIPLRTSTKAGGASTIGTVVLGMVGVFFPTALDNLTPEQALWIGAAITSAVAWLTARFVKSPAKPGAL